MSIRTRFEIETFLLGAHPTKSRQAKQLVTELEQAKAQDHPDLPVLEAVYADFSSENDVEFSQRMVKEFGVATIPMSVFNASGKDDKLVRFCFAKDTDTLTQAAELI